MKDNKFSVRGIRLRQGTLALKALTNPFTPLMYKFSAGYTSSSCTLTLKALTNPFTPLMYKLSARGMEQREAATAGATVTERRGG